MSEGDPWARCRDPGYTPGARDVPMLLAWWEQVHRREPSRRREATKVVVQALARGDRGVAQALVRSLAEADAKAQSEAEAAGESRAVCLRALARLVQRHELPELVEPLAASLRDARPRVVREAARVVGKLSGPSARAHVGALLDIAEQAGRPEQRAAVEALGRVADASALPRLRALPRDDDELARRIADALALITRRAERERGGGIRLDRALPEQVPVSLRCRGGAAGVVVAQARAGVPGATPERRSEAEVVLPWAGPLSPLYQVRSATEVALAFPLPPGASLVERVVAGLRSPSLVAALVAWTEGTPRFRLSLGAGGRRRAKVWEVVRRLAAHDSPLRNDSRDVSWTVEVDEPGGRLLCLPRGADSRFDYRRTDVPAATHPTLAALMAWEGRPREGEVVWDPFCGSGSELVEAARLRSGLHLRGTDVSSEAIETARTNLAAAELEAASVELRRGSALEVSPRHGDRPVSLILSNPPMGRRVVVGERGMRRLLHDFVAHAGRVLAPGGRMIWLSPAPRATAASGRRAGLVPEDLHRIDMGGFFATVQALRRPA